MSKFVDNLRHGAALALLLAACTTAASTATPSPAPTPTPEPTPGPVELVVWGSFPVSEYATYVKEQFEQEHPGVTVRIEDQGWDEALRQNLFNALLAGIPPDVVVGENYFQYFAELGALVPLDDVIADFRDSLIPATYKGAEYQGHIYGLSAFTGVFGFERNCAVIEAAGLDCTVAPQTWDDLLEQVRTITAQGNGQFYGYALQGPGGTSVGAVFRIAVYLAQMDAALCSDPDCTYPYFNNPRAVPVIEFIRELNRYTPPGLTFNTHEGMVYEAMYQGLTAYQIAGSWHPGLAQAAGCDQCRYSSIPVPADGHAASLVVGNVVYAVLSQSRYPDLAAAWVAFLARDDVQDLVYPSLGRLPSTRSALERLRPNVDAATQAFIDELLNNPALEILPQWRRNPQVLWSIYNDMLTQVLTTERPVQEIMNAAQAAADRAMQS